MKVRKSVGIFITNMNGKFLLARTHGRGELFWDIPRGGMEKGETPLNALERELKEELGTDEFGKIKKLNLSFTFKKPKLSKKKNGFDYQKVDLFYAVFLGNKKDIKVDGKEILKVVFVDKNEFIKKASFDTTKNAFKELLKKI